MPASQRPPSALQKLLYRKLNREQRSAAASPDAEVLCLASPGAGILSVVAWRMVLVAAGEGGSEGMCALAFSERSARELRRLAFAAAREAGLPPGAMQAAYIGTVHDYAVDLLDVLDPDGGPRALMDPRTFRLYLVARAHELGLKAVRRERAMSFRDAADALAEAWRIANDELLDLDRLPGRPGPVNDSLLLIRDALARDRALDRSLAARKAVELLEAHDALDAAPDGSESPGGETVGAAPAEAPDGPESPGSETEEAEPAEAPDGPGSPVAETEGAEPAESPVGPELPGAKTEGAEPADSQVVPESPGAETEGAEPAGPPADDKARDGRPAGAGPKAGKGAAVPGYVRDTPNGPGVPEDYDDHDPWPADRARGRAGRLREGRRTREPATGADTAPSPSLPAGPSSARAAAQLGAIRLALGTRNPATAPKAHGTEYGPGGVTGTSSGGAVDGGIHHAPPEVPALHHLLVEGFQDATIAQARLITMLGARAASLFLSGDDDRATAPGRGIGSRNSPPFWGRRAGDVVTVAMNARASEDIARTAGAFAELSLPARRHPKPSGARRTEGPSDVKTFVFPDRPSEARWVAGRIKALLGTALRDGTRERGLTPGDFAVILRSPDAREADGSPRHAAFAEELRALGIPFRLEGGRNPFDLPQTAALLAAFELLADSDPKPEAVRACLLEKIRPAFARTSSSRFAELIENARRTEYRPPPSQRNTVPEPYAPAPQVPLASTKEPGEAARTADASPGGSPSPDPDSLTYSSPSVGPGSSPDGSPSAGPGSSPDGSPSAGPASGPDGSHSAGPASSPDGSPSAGPASGPDGSPSAGPASGPDGSPSAGPASGPDGSPFQRPADRADGRLTSGLTDAHAGGAPARLSLTRFFWELAEVLRMSRLQADPGLLDRLGTISRMARDCDLLGRGDDPRNLATLVGAIRHGAANGTPLFLDGPVPDAVEICSVQNMGSQSRACVFVSDVEQSRFPARSGSYTGLLPREAIQMALKRGAYRSTRDKEARLFYTAMTRASRYLYVTCAARLPGARRDAFQSDFLKTVRHIAEWDGLAQAPAALPQGLSKAPPARRLDELARPSGFPEVLAYLACPRSSELLLFHGLVPEPPDLSAPLRRRPGRPPLAKNRVNQDAANAPASSHEEKSPPKPDAPASPAVTGVQDRTEVPFLQEVPGELDTPDVPGVPCVPEAREDRVVPVMTDAPEEQGIPNTLEVSGTLQSGDSPPALNFSVTTPVSETPLAARIPSLRHRGPALFFMALDRAVIAGHAASSKSQVRATAGQDAPDAFPHGEPKTATHTIVPTRSGETETEEAGKVATETVELDDRDFCPAFPADSASHEGRWAATFLTQTRLAFDSESQAPTGAVARDAAARDKASRDSASREETEPDMLELKETELVPEEAERKEPEQVPEEAERRDPEPEQEEAELRDPVPEQDEAERKGAEPSQEEGERKGAVPVQEEAERKGAVPSQEEAERKGAVPSQEEAERKDAVPVQEEAERKDAVQDAAASRSNSKQTARDVASATVPKVLPREISGDADAESRTVLALYPDGTEMRVPAGPTALAAARANLEWAVSGILARDFPMRPAPEKCRACGYRRLCPATPGDFRLKSRPPSLETGRGPEAAWAVVPGGPAS
ncbi:MAG: hypothetical protein LBT40_06265 [Deltaproteobacteria bacterium]|jgi:superfamily I DNA/RNA helicase|nr:hypothetical protein [Deltaproteobacteria bacterium]